MITKRESSIFDNLKLLIQDTFVYGIINTLSKSVSLFIFPIIASTYSKQEFGYYDILSVIVGLLVILGIFGQQAAVARFIYKEGKDVVYQHRVIFNSLLISFFSFILVLPCLLIILYFFFPSINNSILFILFPLIILQVLKNELLNILRFLNDKKSFMVLSIGYICFYLIAIYIFIFTLQLSINFIFVAQILAIALISLFIFKKIKPFFSSALFNKKLLRDMLEFGYPYLFIALLVSIIPLLNRYVLDAYFSLTVIAEYSIAIRLTLLITFFTQAFQLAWPPFAYSLYKQTNANSIYTYMTKYYVFFIAMIGILLVSYSEAILGLFAKDYYYEELELIISILVLTAIFNGLAYIFTLNIDIENKSLMNFGISFIAFLVSIVFLIVLIPRYGVIGAALVDLIGKILVFGLRWFYGYKYGKYRFGIFNIFSQIMILTIILFFLSVFKFNLLIALGLQVILFIMLLQNNEKERVKRLGKNLLK